MFNYKKLAKVTAEKNALENQHRVDLQSVNFYQSSYERATRELAAFKRIEYQYLQDRYDLLESLLKQLRVNVTLPAKKVAKENV